MFYKRLLTALLAVISLHGANAEQTINFFSPDKQIELGVNSRDNGELYYQLRYKGKQAIAASALGLRFSSPAVALSKFDIVSIDSSSFDETWETVWGEQRSIRNNYRQLTFNLKDKANSGIILTIVFRVFNDGIGFRYEFPKQPRLDHFVLADELTQFAMTADHKAFWIPGDYDSNEFTYYTTRLTEVDASGGGAAQEIHAKTFFDKNAVQTPLMMKSADGLYINIHEAALVNYPAMNLVLNKEALTFNAHLVPDAVGNKAYLQTPAKTPWRTVVVSDKASNIIASRIILNLNEPSRIADPSWIKPQKFVGVWWEMHVGKASWDYSGGQVGSQQATRVPHGATTANVKRYIDFASKNRIDAVLVEGWNAGWEDWFGQWKEDVFDFVTPYPDYDVNELSRYAAEKNVKIITHHETSGSATNYERWMDTAYRFMVNHGMNSLKSGYVGRIIPRGEHHDGQWMIRHFARAVSKAADYRIMVDAHEPVRPTGLHRTWPNYLACEAARGNEFNAWSTGNPPDHETILPFTRLMGGPMDYTPGIFRIKMSYYDSTKTQQVHTTLTKQLALYVTMYSPLQMAADLPENYEERMDAFQFIKDVAVDWDETRVLDAEPGDYLIMARKARGKDSWFLGAITDEEARNFTLPADFLNAGKKYIATIYRDGNQAHWKDKPEDYIIEKFVIDNKTKLKLRLAAGGGTAISIIPATAAELKGVKKYK